MNYTEKDVTIWVEEHSDYLLHFALTKISDRNLALDFIQDTFVSALQGVDSFEGRSQPRTWLTSILQRKIIDHWRKAETRKTDVVSHFFQSKDDEKEGRWIFDKVPHNSLQSVEHEIEEQEKIDALQQCLDQLPGRWKGIVESKYMEDKKGEEICNEYEISSSNFWVIMHRAKAVLRNCLSKKWSVR